MGHTSILKYLHLGNIGGIGEILRDDVVERKDFFNLGILFAIPCPYIESSICVGRLIHSAMKGGFQDWKDIPYLQTNSLCQLFFWSWRITLSCMKKKISANDKYFLAKHSLDRLDFIKAPRSELLRL